MPTKKPAPKKVAPAKKVAAKTPARIRANKTTIAKALNELGITKPFYTCRVVGNRLEFALYGGEVVYWPPKAKEG